MTTFNEMPTTDDLLRIERQAQAMRAQVLAGFVRQAGRFVTSIPARLRNAMRPTAHI